MKAGYRYDAKTCFRCGNLVHYNWYIRHRRSGCVLGIVTPVEASGVAVIYTMLLAFVIHRTRPFSEFPRFLLETAEMTGAIMLLLAASAALSFLPERTRMAAARYRASGTNSDRTGTPALVFASAGAPAA